MARPLRIEGAGLTYHVWARGTGAMVIYRDDDDREHFLDLFSSVLASQDVDCHAYCLMSTHYHAIITTNRPNLSRTMQQLNGPYAEWWDSRHARPGHVFQGRFGAQVIQVDNYLLNACRYVVLNPVRAGLVSSPEDYRWSSYRATARLDPVPPFLRLELLWPLFGSDDCDVAAHRYREFVRQGNAAPALPHDLVLGDTRFVRRFDNRRKLASREVSVRDRRAARPLADLFVRAFTAAARAEAASAAYVGGYRLTEIATFLRVHPLTVRRMIGRGSGERAHPSKERSSQP